jgi:hypothetical protein
MIKRILVIVVLCCEILYGEPIRITDSSKQEKELNANFYSLYFDKQSKRHIVLLSTPTVSDVGEGEIVFSWIDGVCRMWVKIKGVLHSILLP